MISAPARRPRCSAWSVAVSQACSAIITSIGPALVAPHVAVHEAQPVGAGALGGAVAQLDQVGPQLDAGHFGRRPSVARRWSCSAKVR